MTSIMFCSKYFSQWFLANISHRSLLYQKDGKKQDKEHRWEHRDGKISKKHPGLYLKYVQGTTLVSNYRLCRK